MSSPEIPAPVLPAAGPGARVVHLVSRLDSDDAHRQLWPTVLALAHAGAAQCVILLHPADAEHARLLLPHGVTLEVAQGHGWLTRAGARLRRVRLALSAEPVLALHLHGRAASRLGLDAMHAAHVEAPVFFHMPRAGAQSAPLRLQRWLGARFLALPQTHHPAYVVQGGRVDPLAALRHLTQDVLNPPVTRELFGIGRAESAEPLIVTGGGAQDLDRARACAQIAVLLAGSQPAMRFVWLGEAGAEVAAVLKAAQVQVHPARREGEREALLAQAWLYLAPLGDGVDARGLIHAMAAGLPGVARLTPGMHDLVIDTLSGFLGETREALLAGIARLVDTPSLRLQMGHAARERSQLRHGPLRFQTSMLLAHGLLPAARAPRVSSAAPAARQDRHGSTASAAPPPPRHDSRPARGGASARRARAPVPV